MPRIPLVENRNAPGVLQLPARVPAAGSDAFMGQAFEEIGRLGAKLASRPVSPMACL